MQNFTQPKLHRELNVASATMMGLGSILGTGIFVSVGIAAGIAGPSVILAIMLAAIVASCNALSSAQLAAAHPVSGGTYEYGYRYLHPWLGFTAGWMFLCAKIASAATAALGFSGYLLHLFGLNFAHTIPIAIGAITTLTILVSAGIRKSNRANILIVSITLIALSAFVVFGASIFWQKDTSHFFPFFHSSNESGVSNFFYATALMFVAYTGYGRIATLAEEVKHPHKFIPRAILTTLVISAVIYITVTVVAIGAIGSDQLGHITQTKATPLETAAAVINVPGLTFLVALGACTAMLGVLLNLILGLSRVVLAMGRRGDLPSLFAYISERKQTPTIAVISIGLAIIILTLFFSIETAWAFSAFTVLIYYSITNLAALRLPKENQLYPRCYAIAGLICCLFLAFWVPLMVWAFGLGLIFVGLIWHLIARRAAT